MLTSTGPRVALAAGLAALALVQAPGHADASGQRQSDTLRVTRHYGDPAVRVPSRIERVRIRFEGRAGDQVSLQGSSTCRVVLRQRQVGVVARQPSHFWRLPSRATYVFAYHRCAAAGGSVTLRLTKLVVHRLVTDGPPLRVVERGGFLQAAAVRVPASGRLQVTPVDPATSYRWPDLVLPDGSRYRREQVHFTANDLALEAGQPVQQQDGPLSGLRHTPLAAHDRLLILVHTSMTLVASTPTAHDVTVDGPVVQAGNGGRPYRETQLTFSGAAGQWVDLEQTGELLEDADYYRYDVLLDPEGQVLPRALGAVHPYWQLPETGEYRLLVESGQAAVTATVRVRAMRQVGTLPADGTPLTFTAASPGEWMLATFDLSPTTAVRLHLVSTDSAAPWEAFAEWTHRFLCDYTGPLGCGDYAYGWVSSQVPESYDPLSGYVAPGPWVAVVAMPPGRLGSVTLSLVPYTSP